MNRTKAQSRLRRNGYTHETTTLRKDPLEARLGLPKLILIFKSGKVHNGGPDTPRKHWRDHLMPGEVVRPAGKHYIHNGKKP